MKKLACVREYIHALDQEFRFCKKNNRYCDQWEWGCELCIKTEYPNRNYFTEFKDVFKFLKEKIKTRAPQSKPWFYEQNIKINDNNKICVYCDFLNDYCVNYSRNCLEECRKFNNVNRGVYFIKGADKIKIGYSKNVPRRLKTIQNMCPVKLDLIGICKNTVRGDEASFHRYFRFSRSHGEWFADYILPKVKTIIKTGTIKKSNFWRRWDTNIINISIPPEDNDKQVIYFVSGSNKIKIGVTENLESRLKTLQRYSPITLKLLGYREATGEAENVMKKYFLNPHKYWGEWYGDNSDTRQIIKYFLNSRELPSSNGSSKGMLQVNPL